MVRLTIEQALSLYAGANPFSSSTALRYSNYSAPVSGVTTRLLDWRAPTGRAQMADSAMRSFILSDRFSCVAGKAAVLSGGYRFGYYPGFADKQCSEGLARDLSAFIAERPAMRVEYATFVAVFGEPVAGDEKWFEIALWRQLQQLITLSALHFPWDPNVSDNSADSSFAFSFGGYAFFIVGMHARASRTSRRFFLPSIAFNAHAQFEHARETGRFPRIQRQVRARERVVEGSLNPELAAFGSRSEARQYSGRKTEENWECPYRPRS
ncbi:MAG TPA: guanitoxin biosynthesis heme-dependent pre-guanitoxin N-hydroxylase GntA [Candidatus Acidoferrales bacterium]|jgi:FPC/CPF motif-containing protein YcgG|nr:guanitoxin biosynthesis heme-dependent pre-guanitoxin N-hydroxylase GntA [Candidatus Acidoferrales bacterium]